MTGPGARQRLEIRLSLLLRSRVEVGDAGHPVSPPEY